MAVKKELKTYYARDRKTWRQWLEKNHESSRIWIIYYKKESRWWRVASDDVVEEALFFEWIDSTARPLDQLF